MIKVRIYNLDFKYVFSFVCSKRELYEVLQYYFDYYDIDPLESYLVVSEV